MSILFFAFRKYFLKKLLTICISQYIMYLNFAFRNINKKVINLYYKGIFTEKGINIPEEHCFEYALDRVTKNKADRNEFIEWFYSGNWIKIENGDDTI